MKKTNSIARYFLATVAVAMMLVLGAVPFKNSAEAAPEGCYRRTQGTSENNTQTVTTPCPNSGPDDAARYTDGCWVTTGGTFSSVDCDSVTIGVSGNPAPSTSPAAGGTGGTPGLSSDGSFSSPLANSNNRGQCGKGETIIRTGIDLGCVGEDFEGSQLNPIVDMAFALFRFLSTGVGLVVIGSIIVAGIQYSASRGNPQATQAAIGRVTNSITALLIYLFIFSIANFLVPGGMFL